MLYELNRILSGQKYQTDVQRKDMELFSPLWNLFINYVSLVQHINFTNKKVLEFISNNN